MVNLNKEIDNNLKIVVDAEISDNKIRKISKIKRKIEVNV